MQDLHLVGFTTDRRHLIFSTRRGAKSGSFVVPVDDHLLTAVEELANDPARAEIPEEKEPIHEPPPPRVEAKLSVAEVQARLRSGESTEDVAADAGVEQDWVERFAPPIRAEQRQIVERAVALPMERPRAGESAKPLGVAVAASMAEREVALTREAFASAWSSRLVGQGHWIIEFRFTQRGRKRTVSWTFDEDEGRITTSDRTASQIGFVAPPEPPPSKASSARKTATPSTTKKSGAQKSGAKKSGAKKSGAKKSGTTKKSGARKSGATKKSGSNGSASTRSTESRPAAKSTARKKSSASTADGAPSGERSTRGDGRPDSAKSTAAVKKAVASTREALESGTIRRTPPAPRKEATAPAVSEPVSTPDEIGALPDTAASEPDPGSANDDVPTPAQSETEQPSVAPEAAVPDEENAGDEHDDSGDAGDVDEDVVDVTLVVEGVDVDVAAAVDAGWAEPDPDDADDADDAVDGDDVEDVAEDDVEDVAEDDVEDVAEDEDVAEVEDALDVEDGSGAVTDDRAPNDADASDEDLDESDEALDEDEPAPEERVRVRRVGSRRGLRRREAPTPEPSDVPADDGDAPEPSESVRRAADRQPTAQFRSGAAVPARSAPPRQRVERDSGGQDERPAGQPRRAESQPTERPARSDSQPRRAVAPTPAERTSGKDETGDDASPPTNGRRPRRTRPLRAR